MNNYETAVEALNTLYAKGYTTDFSLLQEADCIYCNNSNHSLNADEFIIDEVHRFEGNTDPGDELVVYAISSLKYNIKGTLLNAYGIYADSHNSKIIEKLKYHYEPKLKPIKRSDELLSLSREHHHALLLCWKIKTGLKKNIEVSRIYNYVLWFSEKYLLPHFILEEKYVFPLLNNTNSKKALEQHQQLKNFIQNDKQDNEKLLQFQELLNEHIHFEERILFNEVQKSEGIEHLQLIKQLQSNERFCDNETDPFWK